MKHTEYLNHDIFTEKVRGVITVRVRKGTELVFMTRFYDYTMRNAMANTKAKIRGLQV